MIDLRPVLGEVAHSHERVPLGTLFADKITMKTALDLIVDRVKSGEGGYIVTPNVDHVCVAATDSTFRNSHRGAYLSLVDGMPLLWLARLCGRPLPEKISGSDLIVPACYRAADEGLRVALFGASEENSLKAETELLKMIPGLEIVSRQTPMYSVSPRLPVDEATFQREIAQLKSVKADFVFVAMGTPKQEIFMAEFAAELAPAVLLGIGAGLDFLSGAKTRAPKWAQDLGVEWLFRLAQEPRRMRHRYLVRDRAFFGISLEQIRRERNVIKQRRADD
jgi:N-acetylglucosaminyldiphosphoundecaprenol N-acetyl-beta-D-mannosaminyltransferase